MHPALLVASLFGIGVIYNLYTGDYINAFGGLVICIVALLLYRFDLGEARKITEFCTWLTLHRDRLEEASDGTLSYEQTPITPNDYVTQYQFCISFLIFSIKQPTRFLLKDSQNRFLVNLSASIITLIFGWWALPYGPIYTVQVLFQNIFGGKKQTIKAILQEIDEYWVDKIMKELPEVATKPSDQLPDDLEISILDDKENKY